ncbi:hypothetical protein DCC26_07320, partial [Auritidibacter sp. NML120779]
RHVEVFQMACVGTSIIGRPRPLSSYRRATSPRPPSTPSIVKSRIAFDSRRAYPIDLLAVWSVNLIV